jgi:enoyl-CoA hydratase/carnithine racemase
MTDHVKTARTGAVLELTFARPEKKNAITGAMYEALGDGIDEAGRDPEIKAILISAEGDIFTAGNDLSDFARTAAGGAPAASNSDRKGLRGSAAFLNALANAEKPIVAAVQGRAVGVGGTLLLHCDLVFIAETATITMPFVNLGLVPENASSLLLPQRIGHARAFATFALGEPITGPEAVALGIAYKSLPAGEVRAAAQAAAGELSTRSLSALMATKKLMRDSALLKEVIAREGAVFAAQLRTPEARAAFASFLNKPKVA